MSFHIRPRSNGRAHELRIKHALLAKPFYATFDSADEARTFAEKAEGHLARGNVPEVLQHEPRRAFADIAGAIAAYHKANAVPTSTANVLETVSADTGRTLVDKLDYRWAESWVRSQKVAHHCAPGTIRHHVGALARCLDWVVNAYPTYLDRNPLRQLPRGFASYNDHECALLAERGLDAKHDAERDRRLEAEEEVRIVAMLAQRIATERDPAALPLHRGALLMFRLALETCMRLRELYTLELKQIDVGRATIFLTRTKNGSRREVPLSTVACALLANPAPHPREVGTAPLLFPFWNGDLDKAVLKATSSRVSTYFAQVFEAAGCADFVFHDTRHEATCRLVLRTDLNETEIARITGHRDPRMLRRYMSLRGSELAKRLW